VADLLDSTDMQISELFTHVSKSLCTTYVCNIAQYSSDNLLIYLLQ